MALLGRLLARRARRRWACAGLAAAAAVIVATTVALAAPSDLDGSFSGDGKLTLNYGGTDRATHAAVGPDGKIVVIGSTDAVDGGDFAITRVTTAGDPDSSFSGDGKATVGTDAGVNDIGAGVAVLPDNRIVVSGQGKATQDFVTRRLNTDGGVDGTFNAGTGISVVDFGGSESENAMIRQPDGSLVLVGSTSSNGGDFAIVRLNADGTPDNGFSGDGKQTVDFGGADAAVSVAYASGGKLVVAGAGGAGSDMAVTRLTDTGSVDTSFAPATSGKKTVDFGGTDVANGVAVQPDGKIVLAGSTSATGSGDFAAARLTGDGEPDNSFSGDGKLTLGYGAAGEAALALAIQQNGRIVLLGNGDASHDFVLERLGSDGTPDSGFGSGGSLAVDFGAFEYDGDVVLQPDGKIVVVGSTNLSDGGDIAIARLNGDPVGGGGGSSNPPPTPSPTASFITTGASSKLKGALRLSALGSAPSPGAKLINFHWSISGIDAKLDTDCGPSPVLSHPFSKPGTARVTLTVLDSLGRRSSSQRFVPVTKLGVKHTKGNGVFDCENPAAGNQPDRADCVKSFGAGLLDINSRGAADNCFDIVTRAVGDKTVYIGRIAGPVAVNGLYIPVPKTLRTAYGSEGTLAVEKAEKLSIRVGPFLTKDIDLNQRIVPNKFLTYHLVNVDLATNTPKFLGSLPVRGAFSVDLGYHKSYVTAGLGLPSPLSFGAKRAAQGDVRMVSDNLNGLKYDGLKIKVPDVWLGPLFVNSLGFDYQKSTDTWGGTAKVTLPGSSIALNASGPPEQPPDFGFGIKRGKFDHAGFGVDFLPPTQPDLFPPFNTVLLSHVGAAVGINPLRLTGTIGLNAAHIVDEDGVLFGVFASSNDPYTLPEEVDPELAPLASRTFERFSLAIGGTAKLKVPLLGNELPLLNAYGLYEYPDYFEFGGGLSFGISFLSIDGNVGGFAYPSNRKFNVQGGVKACARNIKVGYKFVKVTVSPCLNVGAVVSSKGLGFCTILPVPFPIFGTIPIPFGVGYHWGHNLPDLMLFSCDYTPYSQASPLRKAAAGDGAYSVDLPEGLPSAMFRVRGQGGDPDVAVTDPKGNDAFAGPDAVSLGGADPDTTFVAIRNPLPGRWTIKPKDGSVPITNVAAAKGLPPLALKTRVTGRGNRRVLHYRMDPSGNRTVTFLERGPETAQVIGVGRERSGKIRFTPGPGRRGSRRIIAEVSQNGTPARNVKAATYRAPGDRPPARPKRLRAARKHGTIRVKWQHVRGARRYEVLVRLADRSQVFRVVRRTHAKLRDPYPAKRGRVLVDALGGDGTRSRAVSRKLKPVKAKKHHRRRHK